MREGLTKNWTKLQRCAGSFNGYAVTGFQFQAPDGEIGWFITAWPHQDPIHDYWVHGNKFYNVTPHLDPRSKFEIFDEVKKLDPAEKKAILEAIEEWET